MIVRIIDYQNLEEKVWDLTKETGNKEKIFEHIFESFQNPYKTVIIETCCGKIVFEKEANRRC